MSDIDLKLPLSEYDYKILKQTSEEIYIKKEQISI